MTAALIVVGLVLAVLWVRRHRRKTGTAVTRQFSMEPPGGRLGKRRRETL